MKNLSLRYKLTLWSAMVVGVTLLLFASLTARHLYREELKGLDNDLKTQARAFFSALKMKSNEQIDLSDSHAVEDLFARAKWNFFIEIEQGGRLVFRSVNCGGAALPVTGDGPGFFKAHFAGKDLRLGVFRREDLTLRLAASLEDVEEVSEDLLISFGVALPLALLALGAGACWLSREALAPVAAIASAAERITARRLNERLPVPEAEDEIRHLTLIFNDMFNRLEGSFQQAVRFTADASHELKTPLTIIRGELEAGLREGAWSPEQERHFLGLLDETQRLSTIIEGLLLLSRADAGKLLLQMESVNLSTMLEDLCEDAEMLAAPQGISVRAVIDPTLTVWGDERFMRQLFLNLLHNAIRYNDPNGQVRVTASSRGKACAVSVVNTGPGIPNGQSEHVFERFYRGDAARGHDGGHGLGLSIAREIARAHDGDLALVASKPGHTEFRVLLPSEIRT